jgi:hypothetical protein
MLRKRDIVATTATRGWFFITERAEAIIKTLTNEAIDCEDKEDSERLVTEARAARKFWKQLSQALEASKQVEVEELESSEAVRDSDDFYEVADS